MPVGCIIGLGSRGRKNRASPPIVGPLCNGVSLSEGPRGRRKSPGRRSEWKEVRRRGSPGCRDVVRDCTPATSIGRQTTLYLSKILEWVCERGPPNGAGTSSVGRGRPSTSRTSWPNSANYHPRFPYGPRVRRCPGLTRTRDTASKFRVRGASLRQLGRRRRARQRYRKTNAAAVVRSFNWHDSPTPLRDAPLHFVLPSVLPAPRSPDSHAPTTIFRIPRAAMP
jgi:hypothetical protein